jgi:pseudaminic acid synthase
MFKIGNRVISNKNKPFIIAEISANHKSNLPHLLKMIDGAAEAGAAAVKIQTILPDEITLNCSDPDFIIKNRQSKWFGKKYFDIYSEAAIPLEWHHEVFKRAKSNNIIAFSSPFDEKSVDFLNKLKMPCFKIASFENEHYPLISKIIETKKPFILSLGMLDFAEINKTVKFLKQRQAKSFALLKCCSVYPASPKKLNLICINDLKKKFKCEIGFSDHTASIYPSIAAAAQGATIIEKHFVYSKKDKTLDNHFSIDVKELKEMVKGCYQAWETIGIKKYNLSKLEGIARKSKRTIRASKKILKGEIFSKQNIKVVRPGGGLGTNYYNKILGKKSKKNINFGEKLKKNHF